MKACILRFVSFHLIYIEWASTISVRLKTAELDQFSHGVLYAAAEVQRLHDEPQVAADLLKSAGLAQVDCCSLDEYDKESLREVNKIRGMGLTGLGEAAQDE